MRDRSGNVATMFALLLIPVLGLAGLSLDYARAFTARSTLDAAVDAALLRAAKEATDAGKKKVSEELIETLVRGVAAGHSWIELKEVKTQTTHEGNQARRAKTTYKAQVRTTLAGVLGYRTIAIEGEAEAALERPTYVDIYLVMDVSASMGLAADEAGRALLARKTREVNGEECTFACHIRHEGKPKSNLEIAQENGIRTRIDITRTVSASLLDDVKAAQNRNVFGPEVYQVGLYSFSGFGVDQGGARTLAAPNAQTEMVRPAINDLHLDNATAYKPMLNDMTRIIGQSGDGSTPGKRRKYMILLTDGHDYGHNWDQSKTIDPRDCQALKDNGVTVYVFNTRWVPDWGNWAFDPILGYKQNPLGGGTVFEALGPKLRECSSGPGTYFEGTDAAEIAETFRKIFRDIQNKLRLSV